MTSSPQAIGRITRATPAPARAVAAASSGLSDARVFTGTMILLAVLFGLLQNRYWVPGGDSEVYTAIAANLALGQDYIFNGQPARIAPPGWPTVMAAVISYVSPTFLVLKLVTLASMLGALGIYYWIIRRYAQPLTAAAVVLLTAVLSHVYPLTFWLHSDALFTLLTAAMVLVALQINEGRHGHWRVALLLLLCAAAAFVRWAALINLALLSLVLIQHGAWRTRRAWVMLALVVFVAFGSFYAIRWGMKHFAPERVAFEDNTAPVDMTAVQNDTQVVEGYKETQEPALITGTKGHSTYATRLAGLGTWYSYLLWQPFRLAAGVDAIWWAATLIGWVVALIVLAGCWPDVWKQQWLLPAVLLYTLALAVNWPHAVARYLVPVAPLIVLSIVRGLDVLRRGADALAMPALRKLVTAVGAVGVASVLLCNLTLYAVDVSVMRARNFYDRYEAGLNKGLMAAAQYLSEHNVGHWQTCVNPEYVNVNKRRISPTGLRIVTMLTGKAALQMPRKFMEPQYKLPKDQEFRRKFISANRVRYYLEQPKVSPWRVWHFRTGWLQERITGRPAEDTGAGWKLYVCDGASMPVQVALPEDPEYPTRVPGF